MWQSKADPVQTDRCDREDFLSISLSVINTFKLLLCPTSFCTFCARIVLLVVNQSVFGNF
jgi:hypothetical protein